MVIKVEKFDEDFVIFGDDVGWVFYMFIFYLGDVYEVVFWFEEVYEGIKVYDFDDFVFVDLIFFWFSCQIMDLVVGCFD